MLDIVLWLGCLGVAWQIASDSWSAFPGRRWVLGLAWVLAAWGLWLAWAVGPGWGLLSLVVVYGVLAFMLPERYDMPITEEENSTMRAALLDEQSSKRSY